ncbi:hypothetical protein LTR29_018118 [Friedmanniomyces endolithicus]|nr:hypothetical protein LTR29_018118 [Friedmanniomyces endolithicus]
MRASSKVPTDNDPDRSWREADAVRRGITIDEHDPAMPNKQSTTQKYTDSPDHEDSKPSSDQCQTSRQASLAQDDVAAQVDLVHPSAGQSRNSSPDYTAASLFPPLGELSDAVGSVQTSPCENHMEDNPAGKPPSASTRPTRVVWPGDRGSATRAAYSTPLPHPAYRDRSSRAVGGAFPKRRTLSDSFDCMPCLYFTDHAACGSSCGLIDITYTESFQRRSVFVVVCRRSSGVSGAGVTTAGITPAFNAYLSEDDDETEIETVRIEPDRVAKPAAVESDTDDGASSTTDEPLSSPLAHKGRRFRQTSVQRAATPAILKTASRLHPHVVKRDRYPKGSSQIERPGDAIRASYGKFGLDAERLIIVPEAQPFKPLSLFMSSAAKVGAKSFPQRMKMLQQR